MRWMARIAAVTSVAAALVALAATSASAAPGPPSGAPADFFGLVSDDTFGSPGEYRQAQLQNQASLGIRLLRQTLNRCEHDSVRRHARRSRAPAIYEGIARGVLASKPADG